MDMGSITIHCATCGAFFQPQLERNCPHQGFPPPDVIALVRQAQCGLQSSQLDQSPIANVRIGEKPVDFAPIPLDRR